MATLCLICEDRPAAERYEIGDQPLVVGRGDAADVKDQRRGALATALPCSAR